MAVVLLPTPPFALVTATLRIPASLPPRAGVPRAVSVMLWSVLRRAAERPELSITARGPASTAGRSPCSFSPAPGSRHVSEVSARAWSLVESVPRRQRAQVSRSIGFQVATLQVILEPSHLEAKPPSRQGAEMPTLPAINRPTSLLAKAFQVPWGYKHPDPAGTQVAPSPRHQGAYTPMFPGNSTHLDPQPSRQTGNPATQLSCLLDPMVNLSLCYQAPLRDVVAKPPSHPAPAITK